VENTGNRAVKDVLNIGQNCPVWLRNLRDLSGKPVYRRRLEPLLPAEKAGGLLLKKLVQYKTPYTYESIDNIFI
jgi:hypothetical protein